MDWRESMLKIAQSRDILDALEHASLMVGYDLSVDDFVQENTVMPVSEILASDDYSSWGEFSPGELKELDESSLSDELTRFRGVDFMQRIFGYLRNGFPPVVIVDFPGKGESAFYGVGDGRGRISVAVGLGIEYLPVVKLTLNQEQNYGLA